MSRFTFALGVLGAVSAVLTALLWIQTGRLERANADARLWEASSKSQLRALEDLQAARQAAEAALVERQARLDALSRKRAAERKTFKEARHADQHVDEWSRVVLPDAVAGLLGQGSAADHDASGPRALGAVRADSGSGAAVGSDPQ